MEKKITVIGGSGFVGTNLCRALSLKQQAFEIIDLRMSREFPDQCKIADVRNISSLLASITGDIVINLAAVHRDDITDKSEYRRTNVEGAANVADACEKLRIQKIIFTSSVAVYGFATPGTNESGIINPFNEYGRTKYEAEEKLRAWYNKGNRELIIIRPTVIFGEGNRGNVFNLLNQIAKGKFIMVGAGKNKKSMAYIANVVGFLESCIKTQTDYKIFNYVDTPDFTMNELVSLVRKRLFNKKNVGPRLPHLVGIFLGHISDWITILTGKRLPISSIRIKKFISNTEFDTNKNTLEAFVAPYSLAEGIELTLESEFLKPDPNRTLFFTE